jgi:hypothetical protein
MSQIVIGEAVTAGSRCDAAPTATLTADGDD